MNETKERHGCVNAWLWIIIISNLCLCCYYAIETVDGYWGYGLLSVLTLGNVLGAILLLRWNRYGFYLLIADAIISMIVNVSVMNIDFMSCISGILGLFIWYAFLQIKKNGVSAWKLMNDGWDYKHCRHLYQLFAIVAGILLLSTIIMSNNKVPDISEDGDEYDVYSKDGEPQDSVAYDVDTITWKRYADDANYCSIEAPEDFRQAVLNEDQILGLICTDYDPAVIVVKESSDVVASLGINSPKEYAKTIVKVNRKIEGTSDYSKISEREYGANSYLIVYEIKISATKFRYHLLSTRTSSNFYYCTVFCLAEYSDKLQETIDRMLTSFNAEK